MNREACYLYVLTRLEGFGILTARRLLEIAGSAVTLFEQAEAQNELSPNIRRKLLQARDNAALWKHAERVLQEAEEKGLHVVTLYDEAFCPLLAECVDAPPLFFYKGSLSALTSEHKISVVGTRSATPYGRHAVAKVVEELGKAVPDLVIVSGLAFGIDIAAHRAALDADIPTIGVMAYGHDNIYPREHRKEVEAMAERGGLLSEYEPKTAIERHRFVARNRIIAGLSPATIVFESAIRGGALLTASMASDYNREVLALPGRVTDRFSSGCNTMIARMQARAFTSPSEVLEILGWEEVPKAPQVQQPLAIASELPDDPILRIIAAEEAILFHDLLLKTDLAPSELQVKLVDLELEGCIEALPGGKYTLAFRL